MKNHHTQLIGNTPCLKLNQIMQHFDTHANIYAKMECFNASGSIKDRIALAMIEAAQKSKQLLPGGCIIEPTSGNTGIGLASVGVPQGYRVIIVMPENFSKERIKLIQSYGGEVVLSDQNKGMQGAIEIANQLHQEIPHSFIPSQFENPNNPQAHYQTTGPEIAKDLNNQVDIFIAAVGTGGTLTGCGRYLKEINPNLKIIAVEPANSPVLSEGKAGTHKIQGIGAGFIPKVLDTTLYDSIYAIKDEDAIDTAKLFIQKEGIGVGISSGAALWACIQEAKKQENQDKNIVVILPDGSDRYYSSELFGGES